MHAFRVAQSSAKPAPHERPAQRTLQKLLIELEKGSTTLSAALRRAKSGPPTGTGPEIHKQLTEQGTVENPRLIEPMGIVPTDPSAYPAAPRLPATDNAWSKRRVFVAGLLRALPSERCAGVDGIPNDLVRVLLTLKDFQGVDVLIKAVTALGSDRVLFGPACASLRELLGRRRGAAFEKPHKPGKYRILDLPPWLLNMYCRYTVRWEKTTLREAIEPYQLGFAPGGPDAFVHIAYEPHLFALCKGATDIVTIHCDVKQNYPDTDYATAFAIVRERAPHLLRMLRLLASGDTISVQRPDTSFHDVLRRTNGFGQGVAGSAAIANLVVGELTRRVHADLVSFYNDCKLPLPDGGDSPCPSLTVTACHDNLLLHVHKDAVGKALALLRTHAAQLKYRLDDWGVFLHGDRSARG